jgi:hypothetical protein
MVSELTPNKNFLSPLGFRFVLKRAPNIEYFCQDVILPEVSIEDVVQETPRTRIYRPGVKLEFAPLNLDFIVDENLTNYNEIHNWLTGLGAPLNSDQYKELDNSGGVPAGSAGIVSDATLIILSSNHNANVTVFFRDMFPISLSPLNFTTQDTEVSYIKATVTFRYNVFYIES